MKRCILIFLLVGFAFHAVLADDIVLFDDFEAGMDLWNTNGWGISDSIAFLSAHSFSESPSGNYPPDSVLIASTVIGANLSNYLGARLEIWANYLIEPAFDFCRIEASRDGNYWVQLGSLTGFNPFWQLLSFDLGAFAGLPDVRIRFRFYSDPLTTYDGLYIDNFTIWGLDADQSGPLIIHDGPFGYEGTPFDRSVYADIWDASGISTEHLYYRSDGRPFSEVALDSVVAERYYHTIPAQEAGTLVEYYFQASDASPSMYTSVSDTFAYLAGQMLIEDDGLSETILEAQPGYEAAVRFQAHNAGYVTSAVIRIYTDSIHPLDSIAVYVWGDSLNSPGSVLAGPFVVFPASTPDDPEAWTWVDLRPALLLAPEAFHVGCQFALSGASPLMGLSYDSPPVYFQSSLDDGSGFQPFYFGDFHIRTVVGNLTPDSLLPPYDLSGVGEGDLLHLSWSPPAGLDDLLRYEIERQGEIIGQTVYLETSYTDTLSSLPQGVYTYRVRARYSTGLSPFSDPWEYQWNPSGLEKGSSADEANPRSLSVFPNPSNGGMQITILAGSKSSPVMLTLFDIMGREIKQQHFEIKSGARRISMVFPDNAAAGIYFLEARYIATSECQRLKIVYLP